MRVYVCVCVTEESITAEILVVVVASISSHAPAIFGLVKREKLLV